MKIYYHGRFRLGTYFPIVAAILAGAINDVQADQNQAPGTNSVAVSSIPALTTIGPHSRTWTMPLGTNALAHGATNGPQVMELATGMNYWNGQQWSSSDASFQTAQNGTVAVVNTTQHKVSIAANLFLSNAVTVITPDGITLNSGPLGIGLFDSATGAFSLIGAITNCTGYFVSSNQLVFSNAFCGVCADVRYTVEKGGFHQDVVITGKLDPADWGYPTNTTRIQVLTEFYNPPAPERLTVPLQVEQDQNQRNNMVSPDLVDQILTFGQFVFGTGRAYTAASAEVGPQSGVLVGKQLLSTTNRTFLIESVPYSWIQAELQSLPDCQNPGGPREAMRRAKKGKAAYAAIPAINGLKQSAGVFKQSAERLAGALAKRPVGLVIDYESTISGTVSSAFQSDTTYFISGPVLCTGPITIEGGAVFKYPYTNANYIKILSALTLTTSSYRPAVFTAGDDNTVGTTITTNIWAGYTGVIQGNNYANPALYLNSSSPVTLSNIRVNYAAEGVLITPANAGVWAITDSQFLNCIKGIEIDNGSGSAGVIAQLAVNNCLIDRVQSVIVGITGPATFSACNTTIDTASNIVTGGVSCYFTNCVLASATNNTSAFHGDHNGFYQSSLFGTSQFSSSAYPYQAVGAGNYYLLDGSPFRAVGNSGIDPVLSADLQQRSTFSPIILSNLITVDTLLNPEVPRDTNSGPDLGYHYPAVDFLSSCSVSNAVLTLSNGVVLAYFDDSGIGLKENSQLISDGGPLQKNVLVYYNLVQEQSLNPAGTNFDINNALPINVTHTDSLRNPSIYLRFTTLSLPSGPGYSMYLTDGGCNVSNLTVRDCEIYQGGATWTDLESTSNTVINMENNVFLRPRIYVDSGAQVLTFNNLYVGNSDSYSYFINTGSTAWTNRDNAFDGSTSYMQGTLGNNAYLNGASSVAYSTSYTNDVIVSSFSWVAGPLGAYYQPTNSSLLNKGSRTAAAAALYQYTIGTNQVKEATNIVTIGLHYVALDGSGLPDNYSGDGIPDYLKDSNGDGIYNSGDLGNWLVSSSSGGLSGWALYMEGRNLNVTNAPWADTNGIVNLQVYTPLK